MCNKDVPDGAMFCLHCGNKLHGEAEPTAFEYVAFISYRHLPRDHEVAKRIQQAIETYRMPRSISPATGDGRLGKCFRDEDELAAAHSLPDRILDALAKSSSLVVVCTPQTKESAWIEREVVAFREMHGPERIFAVLAEGSSAESIPDYLRTNAVDFEGGEAVHSGPLAADMRPEASAKMREETIRLIAAIANCGFDDLRQRDRARRRKRIAAIAAAVVLVVAVIAVAIGIALAARQDALVAESRQLATESQQLLAQGDRYGALEKALEALPDNEVSADRPFVPEAQAALEDALEVRKDLDSIWLASYEIRTEAPLGLIDNTLSHAIDAEADRAGALAVSDDGGFFAVSDSAGNVGTYDLLTGKKLADCTMPEEAVPLSGGLYVRSMGATEHYLLVGNGTDEGGVLAWFEAQTGKQIGVSTESGCPSFNTSYGSDLVSMCTPLTGGGFAVAISDLGAGQASGAEFRDADIPAINTPYFNTPGKRFGSNYAAFGNLLFATQIDSEQIDSVALAYPCATSLSYVDGLVVVSSAEPMTADGITRRFAIEAFDEGLSRKWSYEGAFSSKMIESNGIRSLLTGEPVIYGPIGNGGAILASAGRDVVVLDPQTGNALNRTTFDQAVLDATALPDAEQDLGTVVVTCSNGTVNCLDLFEGSLDPDGDGRRLALPFPIRWAHMARCSDYDVLLAIPADAENRIISFRTDWVRGGDDDHEYSLNELVDQANRVLAEGGRGQ